MSHGWALHPCDHPNQRWVKGRGTNPPPSEHPSLTNTALTEIPLCDAAFSQKIQSFYSKSLRAPSRQAKPADQSWERQVSSPVGRVSFQVGEGRRSRRRQHADAASAQHAKKQPANYNGLYQHLELKPWQSAYFKSDSSDLTTLQQLSALSSVLARGAR